MAFRSNGPVMVALPPFRGITRRIVLAAVAGYFALLVCGLVSHEAEALANGLFSLWSDSLFSKMIWQLVTYPFVPTGLLGTLFAALTVWFFGSAVEDELGARWMTEFFLVCTVGGSVLACIAALLLGHVLEGLSSGRLANSLWPFSLALLVVFAARHPDQELNFNFILRIKAKYIAALYLLVYVAVLLSQQDRFATVLVLTNALAGWLFLRLAPQRGVGFASAEGLYAVRNRWYRFRRRRAAQKFTVYMQKQGRDVHFDEGGRYIDPDAEHRNPNDRKWMN